MSTLDGSLKNYGGKITFGNTDDDCKQKLNTDEAFVCKEPKNKIGSCCIGECDTRGKYKNGFCKLETYESFVEGFTGETFIMDNIWKFISLLLLILLTIGLIISIIIYNKYIKLCLTNINE